MHPNWAVVMELPWNRLNHSIKDGLERGKRLSRSSEEDLIQKTVDSVRELTPHATRSQFCTIAQRMIAKYPDSLHDNLVDGVCGSGYETLLNNLVTRNQNLNTPEHTRMCLSVKKRERTESETSDEVTMLRPSTKHSFGCVSWSPAIDRLSIKDLEQLRDEPKETHCTSGGDTQQIEQKMKSSYALQRQNINNGMSMLDLKGNWHYLFTINGLLSHSTELLGQDVRKGLSSAYFKKVPRLNDFFRTKVGNEFIFKEAQRQSSQDNSEVWLSAVILCIMNSLGEEEEDMFYVVDEMSTPTEIQSSCRTESLVFIVFGDSVLSGRAFTIMCDHVILYPRSDSFIDTFSAFFAGFYIFNLGYPEGVASTLEFIQRCFIGIDPDRGSKGNKGTKKICPVNAKVLELIHELSEFEWFQS